MNVHNFNYSLRCCKLICTALSVLFFEYFIETSLSSSSTSTSDITIKLKDVLKFISISSDNAIKKKKEEWFSTLINEINTLKLSDVLDQWAAGKSALNQAFQFWYFIYRKLLELLILLYMSIRLSNFDGRNAALYSMAPIFFATNHRNYARLLERSFAVNRTNRTFSAIALDQTIEYSINKYGKDLGGISGNLSCSSIDIWCRSLAFRSMPSSIVNAHDNKDLPIITNALHEENIFNKNNAHVRQIMNDKVIHEKIIANVVTMYERGLQGMHSFLQDWYVDHSELDMNSLFLHEFSPAPLSLCDNQDFNLLNQQQKSEIIKLFEK
ncbi:unnamed protein product [Rotaria magnacalcarata]|uniref:Uncharacterized protein n=1 Tax=Rotaria magnacalcarata TaxID=392030 RepID=A0A819Z353_9BILA|nr:unnamed protein product [Rotaria magnacalcarata]